MGTTWIREVNRVDANTEQYSEGVGVTDKRQMMKFKSPWPRANSGIFQFKRRMGPGEGGISQQNKEFTKCLRVLRMSANPKERSVKARGCCAALERCSTQPTSCFSYCWTVLVYQVHSQLFVVKYTTSCTAAYVPPYGEPLLFQ